MTVLSIGSSSFFIEKSFCEHSFGVYALCDSQECHFFELLRYSPFLGRLIYAALATSSVREVAPRSVDKSDVDVVALSWRGCFNATKIQVQLW